MIYKGRFLKVLHSPHISEKASIVMKKSNTIVMKVSIDTTKSEIRNAVRRLFDVEIKDISTLVVKGKCKRYGKYLGRRSDWKKAYVLLQEGKNLDFIGGAE